MALEFVLDTPCSDVCRDVVGGHRAPGSAEEACAAISPACGSRVCSPTCSWFSRGRPAPESGRRRDRTAGLPCRDRRWFAFALLLLVIPPDAQSPPPPTTRLVGLYRGTQDEEIYAKPRARAPVCSSGARFKRADFYALIPPTDDIHSGVRTTPPPPPPPPPAHERPPVASGRYALRRNFR